LEIVINGTPFTITEAKRKLFPKSRAWKSDVKEPFFLGVTNVRLYM
jgi:hypothetical protein